MPDVTRHHWIDLIEFADSYALLSDHPATDTAVVFVHGFMGDPLTTWTDFQSLVDTFQERFTWWRRSDLYFFGYRSVTEQIMFSAHDFAHFVKHIFPNPPQDLFTFPARGSWGVVWPPDLLVRDPLPYSKLVLSGHSEGAILIRKFVLDEVRKFANDSVLSARVGTTAQTAAQSAHSVGSAAARSASIRLFTPASFGGSPSGLPGIVTQLPGIKQTLECFPGYRNLVLDKSILEGLRTDTTRLAEQYPDSGALRAQVLWGRDEAIVASWEYMHDTSMEVVDGKTHTSVCKPTIDYLRPLEFVKYA